MTQNYQPLDADVVIIGAGVSGMTTAHVLMEKVPSLNILILEARDRIGGRTLSNSFLIRNEEFSLYDVGGQWISSQQALLLKLLDQLEIKTESNQDQKGKLIIDYNGSVFKYKKQNAFDFCKTVDKLELASFVQKIETLCNKESLDKRLTSMSMEQFINENVRSSATQAIIKSMIFSHCGVEVFDVSVGFYIFFCISTQGIVNQLITTCKGLRQFWIQNGAQQICNKIATSLQDDILILNNTEVIAIKDHNFQLEIETKNGRSYYSSNVVVAIPPSAISEITFSPPLPPSKLKILRSSLRNGSLVKFVATYQAAFWKKSGCSGDIHVLNGYCPNRPLLCCFDVTVEDKSALSGYVLKNAEKSLVLQQLCQYFGDSALAPLKFATEEWLEGSPMCCYSSFEDFSEMRKSNKRIIWAGAETALEWYGSISGAIYAGNTAAREVLYDIRPGSLTVDDMSFFTMSTEELRRTSLTFRTIYKKIINPYYQAAALVILFILIKMWRNGTYSHIHGRLKNILIKK